MSESEDSPSASGSDSPLSGQQEESPSPGDILAVIDSFKRQVVIDRSVYIKKRMQENSEKVLDVTENIYKVSTERRNFKIVGTESSLDLLAKRQKDAIDMHNGIGNSNGDNASNSSQEDGYASSAILLGSSIVVKNAVRPIKLPEMKRLPPYTSWTFLDRNQRMTGDQSIVGRRRIYYDQNGGEALICSDSEEEAIEDEDSNKEFGESEDYILRMTIKEMGLSDTTFDLLAQCLCRKSCEIKGRYEFLIDSDNAICHVNYEKPGGFVNPYINKDLDAALDSFDNLFCRRCLVFDCRLHGCSQDLVFPVEKQLSWSCSDVEKETCGPNCYRLALDAESSNTLSSKLATFEEKASVASNAICGTQMQKKQGGSSVGKKSKSRESESASSLEIKPINDANSSLKSTTAGKCDGDKRSSKRIADNILVAKKKRQKKTIASDSDSAADGSVSLNNLTLWTNSRGENEDINSSKKVKSTSSRKLRRKESQVLEFEKFLQAEADSGASNENDSNPPVTSCEDTFKSEELVDESIYKEEIFDDECWKPFEKALYEKGIQVFGRNSCLIARNLMNGLKSCSEVFKYMHHFEKKIFSQFGDGIDLTDSFKAAGNETVGGGARRRSRFLRRKGRVRRLKYSWKSAGLQSFRKRISERKDQPCRQYNPCGCQSACGKECPCLVNGTCCEKYCGCPKSCKNLFRGCHCAKSQCRSRQCPCFAADRECDPDVCRNCWISSGDGTLGIPSQRGDNYECRNMKLLLRQQQRRLLPPGTKDDLSAIFHVLLGKSEISGWGAFLKNNVGKNEYLGEYTGELISHREADKRGKIYDRENSSFLFNLNDQFVLDAYRKGDKLKFANHSPDPNCYAKVLMVAGDHRVGIFAKERIRAGEELFYDYRYEPDRAPDWAKKPETSGAKREYVAPSNGGRAKKNT